MDKGNSACWFAEHPQPDVRVEQVAHHFSSSGIARRFPVRNVGYRPHDVSRIVKEPAPVPNFGARLA